MATRTNIDLMEKNLLDQLKATQKSLLANQALLDQATKRIEELYEDRSHLEAEIERWRTARAKC